MLFLYPINHERENLIFCFYINKFKKSVIIGNIIIVLEVFEILKKFTPLLLINILIFGFLLTINPFNNIIFSYARPFNSSAEKIPVLCYHHVYDGNIKKSVFKNSETVVPFSLFEKHMKYLHKNNFYTASLDELSDFMEGKIDLPPKTVVLTFDDGYRSARELIYPILKKYNFNGSVFAIGKYSEEASNDIHRFQNFQYLSFEDMDNISDVFTFENHTFDMHRLDINAIPLLVVSTPDEVKEDLLKLQTKLDSQYLAYPFGAYDNATIKVLAETGHRLAFTVNEGYVGISTFKYEVPRFGIFSYTNMWDFKKIVNLKVK